MNRPREHNLHLPRGLYHKHGAYYLVRAGKWERLGKTLTEALAEYAVRFESAIVAKPKRRQRTPKKIYVISAKNLVKIGIAADVGARIRTLRTGNPHLEIVLYATEAVPNAHKIERDAHRALEEYRVEGEWFRCPRRLAIETVKRLEVPTSLDSPIDSQK